MQALLEQFGGAPQDELPLWIALIDRLRPRRAAQAAEAVARLELLCQTLEQRPELGARLRESLLRLFRERKQVSLYVASGLLPSTGFFSESARRISGRLLPEVVDPAYMKDLLGLLFDRSDDAEWVEAIPDEAWLRLLALIFDPAAMDGPLHGTLPNAVAEIIEALRVLSYHVSAIGLDPELIRIDPTLEEHESPFLAQNAELVAYLGHYRRWWLDSAAPVEDGQHLRVMLGQCSEVVLRVRRRAARLGTSLSLTFKLERLRQHLERLAELLAILDRLHAERSLAAVAPTAVQLFKTLVRAECRKNRLSDYWGQNVELLALRMTESASRTGEHYITSTRSEYFGILGSAALGGLIIALMAASKLVLGEQGLPPMSAALAFCLNYGLGFALIHILGGTVATKQPAMTANAIAASIGESRGKLRELDNLVELVARTVRSQLAAILGNIGVAIPLATLLALAFHSLAGAHFVDPAKAHHLLADVDPAGGALLFAGIAGVCLFLSGLISGYYDNLSAYGRIPERLLQLAWPRRLLGEARMRRVAAYVENNLGALAGNFFFGFLLGGVTALGTLFGLPLDIRHIAFSSAYVGYAAVGLDFQLPLGLMLLTAAGVALIGLTNLAVSFSLTLYVALRARKITFAQGRNLGWLIAKRLFTRPLDFFLPPREAPAASSEPGAAAPAADGDPAGPSRSS